MPIGALILDLDGTLLDTNALHVRAWQTAFAAEGYDVPRERIEPEIGKGGDLLVPAILGDDGERAAGDRLRDSEKREYARLAAAEGIGLFPGAVELVRELRRRGLPSALATSSDDEQLDAAFAAAGVDLRPLVDVVVSADDAGASKPAPDVVLAAIRRLDRPAERCAMVGDTVWDVKACAAAGVPCLGLTCGGTDAGTLRAAGALGPWRDPAHLLAELDDALGMAASHHPRAALP